MSSISESTKKAYENAIKQLRTLTTADVKQVKKIKEKVEGSQYSDSTKSIIYSAIKGLHGSELTEKQKEEYSKLIKVLVDKRRSMDPQVPTEAQKAKSIEWGDVLKLREELKGKIKNFDSHLNYVILCLYTMFPPRRLEYSDMRIVEKEPTGEPTENLFVLDPPTFVFAKFKTAWFFGVQRFPVPEDLTEVLKDFILTWNTNYIVCTRKGEPLSNHTLGNRIITIFKRNIDKDVGASMLRHSFSTYKRQGEMPLAQQEDIASKMGHSVIQSMQYRQV